MKVAIVIENMNLGGGGNERSTEQIARQLVQRGHEVTILTNRCPANGVNAIPGVRIVSAEGLDTKLALGLWRFARWAQRQIDTGGYDVSLSVTTAVEATIVQPRSGTVRETLARNIAMRRSPLRRAFKRLTILLRPKQLMLMWLERRTLHSPRVKKVVAISRYVADQLVHHYTMPLRRIELIPNAAEIERMTDAHRAAIRGRIRERLNLQPEDVVFLFAARNPGLKGLPALLEATARARQESDRVRLIVAGTLDLKQSDHARRLGIDDIARFVGPTREIDALYAAADVIVLPTWYDPASKVVLESLLHGVPAISTRYNGASQWIISPSGAADVGSPFAALNSEGEQPAGRVIDSPADVAGLARAMVELCDDEERQRCAAATAGLEDRISMRSHVDQLEALMRKIADEK